jgi:GxxExxY protein
VRREISLKPINDLTREVIGLAMRVHSALGPGLFETVYELVLVGKLTEAGYSVRRQVPVDIEFEGMHFPNAFKIDILVDERLIIEVKSLTALQPVHTKQLLTYLRLRNLQVGLLLNFGGASMAEGIARVVNKHKDSAVSAASA